MAVFKENTYQAIVPDKTYDYILPGYDAHLSIWGLPNNKASFFMDQHMVTPVEHDHENFRFHGHANAATAKAALQQHICYFLVVVEQP